jgi:predicted metalloprotease with PDZ domain
MRELWKRFGKTEKPYTMKGLQDALAAYANADFAKVFFTKYVYGHASIDYRKLLSKAGLEVSSTGAVADITGSTRLETENGKLVVADNTIRDTPLYDAGVDAGDELTELDGEALHNEQDLESILSRHKAGDQLKMVYKHRNALIETSMKLKGNTAMNVVPLNRLNTPGQEKVKSDWQSSRAR